MLDKKSNSPDKERPVSQKIEDIDEIYAAIFMALEQEIHSIVHDQESFILTIKPNPYSNWNNKYQTFRKLPRK